MNIARVFPRKTNMSPTDQLAFFGLPTVETMATFKADGHTVHDFDRRFQLEDERKVPTNRSFRWSMLDKPPKFVAWECEPIFFI